MCYLSISRTYDASTYLAFIGVDVLLLIGYLFSLWLGSMSFLVFLKNNYKIEVIETLI